jgi:hypothetical protein
VCKRLAQLFDRPISRAISSNGRPCT